ncbi:MAG TPA: hypothetical protein VG714_07785 [Acidobacteriaceae bacterium]|nr:hypothetical protein [Acidobacteriaceae bacterium]
MATIVVGGQASGVGKTGLICGLIAAFPEQRWTAIKVTQCSHAGSEGCECELGGREFAITEEHESTTGTDTARFMAAGAARALWVRTRPGALGDALRETRAMLVGDENILFESNSVLEFVRPEVYVLVVAPALEDFKESARRWLDRVDVLAILHADEDGKAEARWVEELRGQTGGIPGFEMRHAETAPAEFVEFMRERIGRRGV